MNIPEKLKLNKFRLVLIPSTRDLFARYGQRLTPPSDYSGDDDQVFYASSKVEQLASASAELSAETANMPD